MTREDMLARISELEALRGSDTEARAALVAQRELKEEELNTINREIDLLNWVNKPESNELAELLIVQKYL